MDRCRACLRAARRARQSRASPNRNRAAPDRRAAAPGSCRARARSASSGPVWLILCSSSYGLLFLHRRSVYSRKITIKFTKLPWSTRMDCSVPAIRCRQIGEADIAAVAALLGRGFPNRARRFWSDALARLSCREPPPGFPKYGYLLESGEVPVGALLLICSTMREDGRLATRCNLSSWYVEPAYRAYATLLVSQALGDKDATYTNVSAAPHTWPIIEAQGFSRYCDGVFVAVPMLKGLFGGSGARIFPAHRPPSVPLRASGPHTLPIHPPA